MALYLLFHPAIDLCYQCIAEVESSQGRITKNPSHLGEYQISYGYWLDANLPGQWEDTRSKAYAQYTMYSYWTRYAKEALHNQDCYLLSRHHNDGPRLTKYSKTYGDAIMMMYCDKCEKLTKHAYKGERIWKCAKCQNPYQEPKEPVDLSPLKEKYQK